jgi:hypothetical protein
MMIRFYVPPGVRVLQVDSHRSIQQESLFPSLSRLTFPYSLTPQVSRLQSHRLPIYLQLQRIQNDGARYQMSRARLGILKEASDRGLFGREL